jgi:phage terminase large subunit-like protein
MDTIWLDEPPEDIYTECVMRTATADRIVFITSTGANSTPNRISHDNTRAGC